jgi:hypothetical protein
MVCLTILSDTMQAGSGPVNKCPDPVFSADRLYHTLYMLATISLAPSHVQPVSLGIDGYSVTFPVCHSFTSQISQLGG